MEYDADGQITTDYTYGIGLVKSPINGREGFYHTDGLGSTRLITDNVGLITDSYTYDAFGVLLNQDGTFGNSFEFAGKQRDSATGLDYLRARYYDPSLGRFISKDAFASAGGFGFGVGYITGAAATGASGEEILGLFGQWGAGFANGVSGGLLTDTYEYAIGKRIEADHAMLYNAGFVSGLGVGFFTGMQATTWATTTIGPLRWVSKIDDALDIYDAAKSTYGLYQSYQNNGKFEREDVWNLLAYVPFAGSLLGSMKFFAANKAANLPDGVNNPLKTTGKAGTEAGTTCFVAGTEVLTTEGEKDIEDVEVGDWVIADDPTKVEGWHTYFVSDLEILVHNAPCGGSTYPIEPDKQGKHIPGHNSYEVNKSRSILTHPNPQELVDQFAGKGQSLNNIPVGQPGSKERVNFGEIIGDYISPTTKLSSPTTNGIIHYSKKGTHIVPANP